MWGRALIFATVMSTMAGFAADPARAQNLEAGKTPSQIFAGGCAACHKSPRGLLKTVSASALPGFLRQHYTTSSDMASLLASYLVSNGAADTRYQAKQGKDGAKGAKQQEAVRPAAPAEQPAERSSRGLFPWFSSTPQQASTPDADGLNPEGEAKRPGRRSKRPPKSTEAPDAANPEQAATESGHRQKMGKRGKASEEAKPEAAKQDEPAKGEAPSAPKQTGSSEPAAPAATAPSAPEPSAAPAAAPAPAPQ